MLGEKRVLSIIMMALMIISGIAVLVPDGGHDIADAAEGDAPPTRGALYQHSESHNISFNKPTFYDDDDPHYAQNVLKNNTWDDIAFVVFFQDQHKTSKTVGSNTATVADIYQAVFVNLSGISRTTGTSQTILLEDFTATWCGYCTSIIGTMSRLDHDSSWFPDKYIGVEFHISGTYGNTVGSSRKGYYCSGSGIPTWVVDGEDITVGGGTDPNSTSTDSNIKSKINARIKPSPINITAFAGHDDTKAWVNFTFTVEDQTFDNKMTDAQVIMVQDAHPRRHGTNDKARLGWIAQDMKKVSIFSSVSGTPPVISNIVPTGDNVISGQQEIRFDVTDPDASDDLITSVVSVKQVGAAEWAPIKKENTKFIWKTASKTGGEYDFPDGDYQIRIEAFDFWEESSSETVDVTILNPDVPTLVIDNTGIQDQLDLDGVMEGDLDILWSAEDDEDGGTLSVDLFFKRPDIDWTPIAEDIENTGTYTWDTMNPRVSDGDRYVIKVVVTDSDEMSTELETTFGLEINNPDPPMVSLQSPKAGQELSGEPIIRWSSTDDESSSIDLTIDVYISDDDGATWDVLQMGAPSTGSLKFDSNYYTDGGEYTIKIVATDPTGLVAEDISGVFYIYNNDIPEVSILEPRDEDVVSGTIEIEWSSYDEEDADEDLTYSIYYMHSSGTFWKELAANVPNTGSYELDTTELEEGDGVYTVKVQVTDKRDEVSPASTVYFTVYNPDAPEVVSAAGPTSKVEGKATFTWFAEDKDPGETDILKIWFYRSEDSTNWELVAEGIPNTGSYKMDMSALTDGTYYIKMIISDCQEGDFNMTVEHLFPPVTVDNNDPPTVEVTQGLDPGMEYDNSVTIGWEGSDPEEDKLFYSVYFRKVGSETWIPVTGATDMITTSYTIDTSTMENGDYELRIVAKEEQRGGFESEVLTQSFTVKHVSDIIDLDDDDDIVGDDDDDGGSDSNGAAILIVFVIIALIVIIALVAIGIVIMRKKQAEAELPPPGGMPPGQLPGSVPPGQLPGGTVAQGQLPQQQMQELPPAPAPVPQTPPAQQPVQEAPAPAPETAAPAPAPETAAPEQTVEMPAPEVPPQPPAQ